jgi:hypothetical protein
VGLDEGIRSAGHSIVIPKMDVVCVSSPYYHSVYRLFLASLSGLSQSVMEEDKSSRGCCSTGEVGFLSFGLYLRE